MIGEYEIPKGSKLYFGKKAALKRSIENSAVKLFEANGYEEIVTPLFSYHQTDSKDLIRFGDETNNQVAIRSDSALEVVRLIQKRLGKSTTKRKWFYVQPIFAYPTTETHQIGAESIDSDDLANQITLCGEILNALGLKPVLQIGSVAALSEIKKLLNLSDGTLERHNLHLLFERKEPWVKPLLEASKVADLEKTADLMPQSLKQHLSKMITIAKEIKWANVTISPFYYSKMAYYDECYFRFLLDGKQLAMGGSYDSGEGRACGFALYTDALLAAK